ncbi:MAG: HD domain-containing protein [Candidatus Daviesbacteria bacterium]|nr:HD domain-containing protein [Candidatus Daviesbacteria bacterium]
MDLFTDPIIQKAFDFANLSLAGQKRLSGENVIDHCKRVEKILWDLDVRDPITLSTAILHHAILDGAATSEDIKKEFGEEIVVMLETIDKLQVIKLNENSELDFSEQLRKMFLVLAKDLRIVLIKLADIADNLTTLKYLKPEKRKEVAEETLEIFAPLCDRLGMGELRGQMQDLAFENLYPKEYLWLKGYITNDLENLGKDLLKIKAELITVLKEKKIDAEIQSRIKHTYSLYTKLLRPEIDKDLKKVKDLIALRIIVNTEEECYKSLDIVQNLYKILPDLDAVSDYIVHPKPNGYRSIHIKVYGPNNLPFEIQIRTRQMHEEAEYGLAAHWNYAEKKESGLSDEKISQGFATSAEKLEWVKSLGQWQKEISDNQEFLKTVKTDFFGTRIYCFTPKGDVKDLPDGATPIDFAYRVHTDLGNRITGVKVNGKVVALDSKLKNGNVVEILLSKDLKKKPSRDWLQFVVTGLARRQIKRAFN